MFLADFIFAVSHLKNTLLISRVQCHRSIVSISQVRNFFSWAFPGSEIFSRGYFVSPKFFSWVFRWSEINSRGYFMGTIFFSWVFHGSNNFSREYFVGPKFCHRIPFLEKKKTLPVSSISGQFDVQKTLSFRASEYSPTSSSQFAYIPHDSVLSAQFFYK